MQYCVLAIGLWSYVRRILTDPEELVQAGQPYADD